MPGTSGLTTSPCEAALAPRLEQRILPGIDRTLEVLAALGHPERAYPSALIVGTNGKGSTAALLASILAAHGLRVGLYTSPHLVGVEERIRVAGAPIAQRRLLAHLATLNRFPKLSYFETLTAAAFLHFAEESLDVAVLEAGLGGRWDATNAAEPAVTLLTNVGTDHQSWLGTTRPEIAAEKAAALRGREAIVGEWDDEVAPAIRGAADPSTPLTLVSEWALVSVARRPWPVARGNSSAPEGPPSADHGPRATGHEIDFAVAGVSGSATLPLLGRHQLANLRMGLAGAAALAKHAVVPPLAVARVATGIEATSWPGRLQWVEWRGRRLLLDGAHNREAVRTLAAALPELGLTGRPHLLFSCLADKPLAEMAAVLAPLVKGVSVVELVSPRATPIGELAQAFPGAALYTTVANALSGLPQRRPALVTGSLRLVGEVLATIGEDLE